MSFQSAKSGAGEQFLLLACVAKACTKGVLCSQTPVAEVPVVAGAASAAGAIAWASAEYQVQIM